MFKIVFILINLYLINMPLFAKEQLCPITPNSRFENLVSDDLLMFTIEGQEACQSYYQFAQIYPVESINCVNNDLKYHFINTKEQICGKLYDASQKSTLFLCTKMIRLSTGQFLPQPNPTTCPNDFETVVGVRPPPVVEQ